MIVEGSIPWTRLEDIEGKYLNDSLSKQYVTEETVENMNLKIETDHGSYLDEVTYDIFMRYFNYTLEKQMDDYHFYHLTHKVDRVGKMSIFYQNEEDVDVLEKFDIDIGVEFFP
mgnify:CR=1 FL=1